ncbi:MAG: hypothetical protein U0570_08315 [Phycisphaerales bacterium]
MGLTGVGVAAPIGSQWVEVENQFFPGTATPTGLAQGTLNGTKYRTFDLYVTTRDRVIVLDSAVTQSSGSNIGVRLSTGAFFQRSVAGNPNQLSPKPGDVLGDPLLAFDTFCGLGNRPPESIVVTTPIVFSPTQTTGTWSAPFGASEAPDDLGRVFAGRFTVPTTLGFRVDESGSRQLGGTLFVFTKGSTTGQVVELSNAYATCRADLNNDRQIDDADFTVFVIAYDLLDCANPAMPPDCLADLNLDGFVDDGDFQIFVFGYDLLLCP